MNRLHTLNYKEKENQSLFIPETEDRETAPRNGLAVSEEEYWDKYYSYYKGRTDLNFEWKNGYLEEKPMADFQSSLMYRWFLSILECYFSSHPVGKIVNPEIGFRLAFPGGVSIRKPDIAVILNENPIILNLKDCSFKGIYDLCIESLSYSDSEEIKRDTVEKKEEYAGTGVREYYILDARGKETVFYSPGNKGKYIKIKPEKGIIRSEVLPGFQFKISDLYDQPCLEKLSEKETYKHYVLPFYNKAKQRAEQAEKRFLETASNMLTNGLDIERIMKYTGLSADELEKICKSL